MTLRPLDWGFSQGADGGLVIGGAHAAALADEFGTPLHVVDEAGLRRRAAGFRAAFEAAYPGPVAVHYAMKCNNTPGIVRLVFDAGVLPEVGTPYEWCLARRMCMPPEAIIVNGPNKGDLLRTAIAEGAGLIVLDGPQELEVAEAIAREAGQEARVLVRVNPNVVPKGMNRASATGSRTRSVFGFDLVSGEVAAALSRLAASRWLRFAGLHCHVGTGIRRTRDYEGPLELVLACAAQAERLGLKVEMLDVGGGFGVSTSRELDTLEFLTYQAAGRLPPAPRPERFPTAAEFAAAVAGAVVKGCARHGLALPRLVVEPGRAILSSAVVLLVRVGAVKHRSGVGTWVITDGAAGTVAFPLFYEYHEVLLCRAPAAPRTERYTIVGPVCFSADWIYRNKRMPETQPGDVLAVCDAGAYFTVQESNFGFPRPAIVAVEGGVPRVLRRRETFDDMVCRDSGWERPDEQ